MIISVGPVDLLRRSLPRLAEVLAEPVLTLEFPASADSPREQFVQRQEAKASIGSHARGCCARHAGLPEFVRPGVAGRAEASIGAGWRPGVAVEVDRERALGDDVVAAAMIDRLGHDAEILAVKGDGYRLRDLARPPATSD